MRQVRAWLSAPFGVGVAVALMLAMVVLAMNVTNIVGLNPFGPSSVLDYAAPPFGAFYPLRAPFVSTALGSSVRDLRSATDAPAGDSPDSAPRMTVTHALTNDDESRPYEVSSVPFTARSNTSGATREFSTEPTDCAPIGSSVWYRYRPTRSGAFIARASGNRPIALAVYLAPASLTSHALACSRSTRGHARIAFPGFAGATYLFQITNPVLGGDLVFSLDRRAATTPVSVLPNGAFAGAAYDYGYPRVSANARYVAFVSDSTELDPRCAVRPNGDRPCGLRQVYVRDLRTGQTELASLTDRGTVPNDYSEAADMSADGRYVTFQTRADNVGPGPDRDDLIFNDREFDVFLRDRLLQRTERITVAKDGSELNGGGGSISADGRFIAFWGDFEHRITAQRGGAGVQDIYVKDRATGEVSRVSDPIGGGRSNHDSINPRISPDGYYVAFWTRATNMSGRPNLLDMAQNVAGIYRSRIYVYDRHQKRLTYECVAEDGTPANDICTGESISSNGRYSLFWSCATNLLPNAPRASDPDRVAINLYLRDRSTGRLELINVADDATPIPDQWDRQIEGVRARRLVQPYISPDGSFVVFDAEAPLTAGDGNRVVDAYVRDRIHGRTILMSGATAGAANGESVMPAISADGSLVAFLSMADNLTPADTNKTWDVYVRQWII